MKNSWLGLVRITTAGASCRVASGVNQGPNHHLQKDKAQAYVYMYHTLI